MAQTAIAGETTPRPGDTVQPLADDQRRLIIVVQDGTITTLAGVTSVSAAPAADAAGIPVRLAVEADIVDIRSKVESLDTRLADMARDVTALREQGAIWDPRARYIQPGAFANRGMLTTAPGPTLQPVIWRLYARSDGPALWLMIFRTDDITTVANGTAFLDSTPLPKQGDGDAHIEAPIPGSLGMRLGWALSTTPDTLTLAVGLHDRAIVWGYYDLLPELTP